MIGWENLRRFSSIFCNMRSPLGWRAYDVVVENISLVNNYRSQFDRFLNKKSFDELLQELRDKKNKFN